MGEIALWYASNNFGFTSGGAAKARFPEIGLVFSVETGKRVLDLGYYGESNANGVQMS